MAESHDRTAKAAHEVTVEAPAEEVYRLLADLDNWPWVFSTFVHAEPLGMDGRFERVGMWTTSADQVEHWVALRRLDDAALRIDFRPERPAPPLATMERSWVVEPLSERECTVRILHTYGLLADDPAALRATADVIDSIADAETSRVKWAAELLVRSPELLVRVTDTVEIAGSAERVHDVLFDAPNWPTILPHVVRVNALQNAEGLQLVEVDTVESSGTLLTMKTARVGLPHRAIAYKQLMLPPIGSSHHVRWSLTPTASAVTVASEQTVVIKPSGIARLLGSGKGTAEVTAFVQEELSTKVRLTLEKAKEHVEAG